MGRLPPEGPQLPPACGQGQPPGAGSQLFPEALIPFTRETCPFGYSLLPVIVSSSLTNLTASFMHTKIKYIEPKTSQVSQRRQVLPLQLVGGLFPFPNYSFCPFYPSCPTSLLAFPTMNVVRPGGGEESAGRAFSHLHLQPIPLQDLQQEIPPQSIFPLPAPGFFSRCFLKLCVETAGVIES